MKTQINSQFIIRGDYELLPDNIIGVAVLVYQKEITHAGIFIRYNQINYLLHFGKEVKLEVIPKTANVFFKQLAFIPPEFIPSTYHLFTKLAKAKKPGYGYFYSGSFYDETTLDFIDDTQMPEVMSCVGFCLNVLKTVLRKRDFIKYTDWHYHDGIVKDSVLRYLESAKQNYPDLDLEEYIKHIRRILPAEYFTAGFSDSLPVTKAFTDANLKDVSTVVLAKAV